jgi:hypothetical protein
MFPELLIKGYSTRARKEEYASETLSSLRGGREEEAQKRGRRAMMIYRVLRVSPFGGGFRKKRKQTDVRKNKLFRRHSFSLGVVAVVVVVVVAVVRLLLSLHSAARERETRHRERERQRENTPHQNSLPSSLKSKFGKRCPTTRK